MAIEDKTQTGNIELSSIEVKISEAINEMKKAYSKCPPWIATGLKKAEEYLDKARFIVEDVPRYNSIPIEELNLPPRPYNALKKAGIDTVGQLIINSEDELLALKNGFGKKSLQDTKKALSKKYGVDVRNPSYKIK